jgi:hypothetical protein
MLQCFVFVSYNLKRLFKVKFEKDLGSGGNPIQKNLKYDLISLKNDFISLKFLNGVSLEFKSQPVV